MQALSEILRNPNAQIRAPRVEEPMEKLSVYKQAASVIKELNSEVKELHEKLARYESAERLIRKMSVYEDLSSTEMFEKFSEYKEKSEEELQIIEKAMDLIKSGNMALGTLSDHSEPATMDPLTSYLINSYQGDI